MEIRLTHPMAAVERMAVGNGTDAFATLQDEEHRSKRDMLGLRKMCSHNGLPGLKLSKRM